MKLFHIAASFAASAVSVIPVVLHAQEGPATQPAARAANAVPTMDDLRTAMNNQAYPEALRIANRLLAQQGPPAAALNNSKSP